MANKKISELTAIVSAASNDLLPVVDISLGSTTKATITQVAAAIPVVTTTVAGTMSAVDKQKLDNSTSSNTASTLVLRDGSGNAAVNVLTAAAVTVTGAPSASTDACNKAYVDAVAVGLTIKASCNAATTANITNVLTGAPATLDGVSLSVGYRILVKDQSTATQNGIYSVTTVGSGANGVWARATDSDTGAELPTNSYTFVNAGTANSSTGWVMNTAGVITIGVSNIVWVLFSQITSLPAANITGQLVTAQIADAAINTAKFAAGITPVEIVSVMPNTGNFRGRTVFLTTVDGSFAALKMYRWTTATTTGTTDWTAAVPAVDVTGTLTAAQIASLTAAQITGQITTTQITDGAISTPKIAAGAVTANEIAATTITAAKIASGTITATQIAAGTITATQIATDTITAGQIAAGAIGTSEIAALAVTAAKIAAGTITANEIAAATITAAKLNVATLSSITANIGTITAGTISGTTITAVGSDTTITLNPTTGRLTTTNGNASASLYASNPGPPGSVSTVLLTYSGGYRAELAANTSGGFLGLYGTGTTNQGINLGATSTGGIITVYTTSNTGTITLTGSTGVVAATEHSTPTLRLNTRLHKVSSDTWSASLFDGSHDLEWKWNGSALQVRIDASTVLTVATS